MNMVLKLFLSMSCSGTLLILVLFLGNRFGRGFDRCTSFLEHDIFADRPCLADLAGSGIGNADTESNGLSKLCAIYKFGMDSGF